MSIYILQSANCRVGYRSVWLIANIAYRSCTVLLLVLCYLFERKIKQIRNKVTNCFIFLYCLTYSIYTFPFTIYVFLCVWPFLGGSLVLFSAFDISGRIHGGTAGYSAEKWLYMYYKQLYILWSMTRYWSRVSVSVCVRVTDSHTDSRSPPHPAPCRTGCREICSGHRIAKTHQRQMSFFQTPLAELVMSEPMITTVF